MWLREVEEEDAGNKQVSVGMKVFRRMSNVSSIYPLFFLCLTRLLYLEEVMDGGHCQLDQLPRGHHPNPNPIGDIYGSPPVRKQRTRKNKETEKDGGKLDTINERPIGEGGASWSTSVTAGGSCAGGDGEKSQAQAQVAFGVESVARKDASTSTTDLCVGDLEVSGGGNTVKKVQKGQIHALAKMLSALRREK